MIRTPPEDDSVKSAANSPAGATVPIESSAPSGVTRTPQFGGWVRMDSDSVLRGWVTDRADRSLRFDVEIFVDDMFVAVLRADALDPKLVQLGEGDGRYAFSLLAPPELRDGRVHSFQARVRQAPFTLKCKQANFQLPADASTPRLQVSVVSFAGIRGWLHGGQYAKSIRLGLWSEGARIDPDLDTLWSEAGGVLEFLFEPTPSVLDRLCNEPLGLAAPGMAEAGFPIAEIPRLDLGLQARRSSEGLISVNVVGDVAAVEGESLWFRLCRDDGEPLLDAPAPALQQGATQFSVPTGFEEQGIRIIAGYRGELISALTAPVRRDCLHWVRNPGFERWRGEKPEDWSLPGPVAARSYFDFSGSPALPKGLTGDTVRFEVYQSRSATALLRQDFGNRGPLNLASGPVPASLVVRADRRLSLDLTLTDENGQAVGSKVLEAGGDWTWRHITADIPLSAELDGALTLGINLASGAGILELAGLTLGEDFSEPAATVIRRPSPENLVANADLMQWPTGLVLDDLIGRSELARGWFAVNHRSAGIVRARALLPELEEDGVALAIAVAEVQEHFRLEIRLDPKAAHLDEGVLEVEIGSPTAARRLIKSMGVCLPDFGEIDRIQIVRRFRSGLGRTEAGKEEILATLGRRMLVTRNYHRYRLSFVRDRHLRPSGPQREGSAEDCFLVVEFRQPFAIAIRNIRLCSVQDALPHSPPGYLALEDRHIQAQAGVVTGLDAWVAPSPQTPNLSAAVAIAPRKWRWTSAPDGGLAVLIHGAEAVQSALETLDWLQQTTSIPHTVVMLCGPMDNVRRVLLGHAVEGRPWISVIEARPGCSASEQLDATLRGTDAVWIVNLAAGDRTAPDWLEAMVLASSQDPQIGLCGPLTNAAFLGLNGATPADADGLQPQPLRPGETLQALAAELPRVAPQFPITVPVLADTALMVRRAAFIAVGGLNTTAFPSVADALLEFGLRASREGWRLTLAAASFVFRPPAASKAVSVRGEGPTDGWQEGETLPVLLRQCRELPEISAIRAARQVSWSLGPISSAVRDLDHPQTVQGS